MLDHPYDIGLAIGALHNAAQRKSAGDAALSYGLKGKLYLSRSGWLLLSVPNAIGRGAFDALHEEGVELPVSDSSGNYSAHVSVIRPEELATIPGGVDAITERGHEIEYTLGPVRTVQPSGWADVERVWFIEIRSPALERLRRSYGLTSLPKRTMKFHVTFALRRKHVLRENGASKTASLIHYPEEQFLASRRPQPAHDDFDWCVEEAAAGADGAAEQIKEGEAASKSAKDVTPIIRRQREELHYVDYCPHCNEEIGEKSMYCDPDGYEYHRPCRDKGPIGFSESGRRLHRLLERRPDLQGEKEASGDMLAYRAWKARGLSDEAADYRAGVSLELPGDIPKGEICPHCGERLEYNAEDEKCNHCGKSYPAEKLAVYDLAGVKELIEKAVKECTTPASEEQADAGNYKKGHLTVYGIPITIETGKGMTRSGTSKSGKKWSTLMKNSYGYIKRTTSEADGDHIDVFLNDDDPIYEKVFVVDQIDPGTGDFDEHKCMLFFGNEDEAKDAYLANYEDGWQGCGGITEMSLEDFKDWCANGDTAKPLVKKLSKAASLLSGVSLQPQQSRIADEAKHQRVRKLLYHSLGSGKTLASIATAESAGEPYVATVPAALRPNFQGEQARFTDMQTPSTVESYNALAKQQPPGPVGTAIFDEAQRLRNPESLQTQQAKILARRAKNLLLLSGTPIVNSPGDFAPLQEMLTGQPTDPKTYEATFVGQKTVRPSLLARLRGVRPAKVPVLRNQNLLRRQLAGHIDYHAPVTPDVQQLEERYTTPMSPEQTKLYQAFWQQLPWILRWKLQHEFPLSKQEIGNMSSFLSGPRQVSLSTLPFMRGRRNPMLAFQQSPKLQKAMQLAQETFNKDPTSKIVAFSNFLEAGLQPYAAALAAKKIPYAIFHGGMNDADRKRAVADYNANRIRALLIAPAGSEGISLKGTTALQLLDPHWNEARLDQAIGRGIRFDSHTHLPPEQRKVRVQRFLSELPPGVLARLWRWVIQTKPGNQMNNPGTDAYLEGMAKRKQGLNDQFLNLLKEIGSPKAASVRPIDLVLGS